MEFSGFSACFSLQPFLMEKVRCTNQTAMAKCAGDQYGNQELNFYPQWFFLLLCLDGLGHSCIWRMEVHW